MGLWWLPVMMSSLCVGKCMGPVLKSQHKLSCFGQWSQGSQFTEATLLLHASYLNNLLLYHPCWLFSELLSPKSRKRLANAVANSSQQHCLVKSCRSPISVPFICSASYLWLHNSSVLETKAPLSDAVLHMQTAHLLECPMWSWHHIWLRSLWKSHHYIEF